MKQAQQQHEMAAELPGTLPCNLPSVPQGKTSTCKSVPPAASPILRPRLKPRDSKPSQAQDHARSLHLNVPETPIYILETTNALIEARHRRRAPQERKGIRHGHHRKPQNHELNPTPAQAANILHTPKDSSPHLPTLATAPLQRCAWDVRQALRASGLERFSSEKSGSLLALRWRPVQTACWLTGAEALW